MTDELSAAVWLQAALGPAAVTPIRILKEYGSAAAFLEAGEHDWRLSGLLRPGQIEKLLRTPPEEGERILRRCAERGITVLCHGQKEYPRALYDLGDAPLVLYLRGSLPPEETLCIGGVGTRHPGEYAKSCAMTLCADLARQGVCIVSGGAMGIDSACHMGALSSGGRTVAVLGCGLDYDYLRENRDLRESISRRGALLSEYPPDASATRYTFVQRNRIIAGLSAGLLVAEAGLGSGALITAGEAEKLGRPIFCVTGAMTSPAFSGTNEWLAKGRAYPVFSARDILMHCPGAAVEPAKAQRIGEDEEDPGIDYRPTAEFAESQSDATGFLLPELKGEYSPDAALVYSLFHAARERRQTLLERSGLPASRLLGALTMLELGGAVTAEGEWYRIS